LATERVKQNLFSDIEVSILKNLAPQNSLEEVSLEVSDLSGRTGINDNDEVLRALYTLEGKSLVQPCPPGDFTSNVWAITDVGVRALELMSRGEL